LNLDPSSPAYLALAILIAVIVAGVVAAIAYRVLGLARDRYEVESGLAQLGQISWHELQVLIGLGLRGRGLGAVGGDHDDVTGSASDLLLSDGETLQLLRVKHGSGLQVDEHTVFDLATRRDARRAKSAILATTGKVRGPARLAAREANITLLAGPELWSLVSEHLPPRLRERIANRRRSTLRNRIGLLVGSSALAGTAALALTFHVMRSDILPGGAAEPAVATTPPTMEAAPDPAAVEPAPVVPATTPAPAVTAARSVPQPPAPPLDEATLQERRREAVQQVRAMPAVQTARWSTASTIEVTLKANANLQDDSLFVAVCDVLRPTEELRVSRVQLEIAGGDPSKAPTARWRQCQ